MTKNRWLAVFAALLLVLAATQLFGARGAGASGSPPFTDIAAALEGVDGAAVAWGDYNGDGRLDAVVTGFSSGSGQIARLYRNNGNGTFSEDSTAEANLAGVVHGSAAWCDYDNDGELELLLTGSHGTGSLTRLYHLDGSGVFQDTGVALDGIDSGSAVFGDYNNDGRPDLLLAGSVEGGGGLAKVYTNTGSGFVDAGFSLLAVSNAAAAWGDYDSDGRLDILLTGLVGSTPIASVYTNTGSGFSKDGSAGLTGLDSGSAAWGDYDNDGKPDILLTGQNASSTPVTALYRSKGDGSFELVPGTGLASVVYGAAAWGDFNADGKPDVALTGWTGSDGLARVYSGNGAGAFTDASAALAAASNSSLAWGDYNSDGKLDLLVAGSYQTKIYRNDLAATNTAPSAPTNPMAKPTSGSEVTLRWRAAQDSEQASGLTYNLRVGTSAGGVDVIAPMSLASGKPLVAQAGNAGERTSYALRGLTPGATYYWSVQAIDASYQGSVFTDEGSFTMAPVFAFSAANYYAAERDGVAQINIKRSGLATGSDSVHVVTVGSDYTTAADQTVDFGAEQTAKMVQIPIIDDDTIRPNGSIQLTLSNPSPGGLLGSQKTATLTVYDNDTPPPAFKKSAGKIASARLTQASLTRSQAGTVKLLYRVYPKSSLFAYALSLKKGKKWALLRSVGKTGTFFGNYTLTVKQIFGSKPPKKGLYRLKLSADTNSKTLGFRIK